MQQSVNLDDNGSRFSPWAVSPAPSQRSDERVLRLRHQTVLVATIDAGGWASDSDHLTGLSRDLLLQIETFLPVQTLLILTTVSSAFRIHLTDQEVWRSLFLFRWGSECKLDPSTKVSPSLYSMISSTSLWATIERAFTLSPTISRNYKNEQTKV